MASLARFVVGAAVAAAVAGAPRKGASPIKYIIVLMEENRSFDHLLGHLMTNDTRIDGVNTSMYNPIDPSKPDGAKQYVNWDAVDGGPVDPAHDFTSITEQVFGYNKPNDVIAPVKMNGFALTATKKEYAFVMSAFNATNLPVLSTLAQEFAVFDHWHCSCPCPTNPNREFLMSGTAHGMTTNDLPKEGFPQQTHFMFLEQRNVTWKIYYNDDPWMAPAFVDLRTPSSLEKIVEMPQFFTDLTAGTLPQFSLIQPRMATSATGPSNWQHPDNSVQAGEKFYSDVYTALRASPYWEESMLIITYDEHGGFFDHQPTPATGVPAPDNVVGSSGFKYDRLGVRIPTVVISPWVKKGTVVHEPAGANAPTSTSQYDATSIISTANKIFGIDQPMSLRTAWAGTFDDLVSGATPLRTDCPRTMPEVAPLTPAQLAAERALPLNDHHLDSLNLLCGLTGGANHPACANYAGNAMNARRFVSTLRRRAGKWGVPAWQHAAQFPELNGEVARYLRQEDFEEISKPLWAEYRQSVFAGTNAA